MLRAIFHGHHLVMSPLETSFLCLVLAHSENMNHQELCLDLWLSVSAIFRDDNPLKVYDGIFRKHHVVIILFVQVFLWCSLTVTYISISKFNRFPHRNSMLSRDNTKEEEAFLQDLSFRFDLPMKHSWCVHGNLYFAILSS